MSITRLLLTVLWALATLPAAAQPELCEAAARRAAQDSGVPVDVLLAIALTETGRAQGGTMRPWPWTANEGGRGHWFATRAEAAAFARTLLAQGRTSFDLGCFQINWRWHGDQFRAVEDLLDPMIAARYAATLLARLHAELGSWDAAAGAYHSRTPRFAARYRARFADLRAGLRDASAQGPVGAATGDVHLLASGPAPPAAHAPRVNGYPLLSGVPSGASLVPAALPAARPLFEN